ncbi:unnamed protein product [Rotaria magnacalcarata]|uniref:Uncharacterized protein n=2 Tax=Rotaria magnacalcarata TaxID=392030 RepID=A0A815P9P6_9BILA|nr:unnamed protein product [Rotaria magnacalcarata]CAF1561609.1 unnamed protein product [Rotaria magnacalcarata]CAF4051315.1 unnamed protein product [Rotaria magnacalcarata]
MIKEQLTTNSQSEAHTSTSEELIANSLPPRIGPYRSLSAKRPRDPSHRKSVSFNDVPIVHEVPSHDAMRNSNCDAYRSWAHTDATLPSSGVPSFYSSQILLPFNSTSAAAQKINASRLSSTLYSTPSSFSSSPSSAATPTVATTTTNTTATNPTANRIPDWAVRAKSTKPTSTSDEATTTNENHSAGNPPVIIVHLPDERTSRDTTPKPSNQSIYNSVYLPYSHTSSGSALSSSHNVENGEERKHSYRSAMIPDIDHYRSIPFSYAPMSDSAATYTSMLSTNLVQSNHSSNEHSTTGYPRAVRARSATLPVSANHSATRTNDNISITPFRATATNPLPNNSNTSTRTVLRPTTIAFQCSQPTNTTMNINNGPSTITTLTATSNTNQSSTTTTTNTTKPPATPSRFGSTAAAAAAVHSRFVLPSSRTLSTSSLNSSAIKYTFAHPNMDSTFTNTTTQKPPPTTYARSRSAHVLSTRRTAPSPVVMLDGHSNGGGITTNPTTNLYATTKRNPNVRQTYGSYYMHRVLLPTSIH